MAAPLRTLEAEKAAAILMTALKGHRGDLTVADAAAKGGIALREAELGLHYLSSKYRGTLSATANGDLLFRFPYGLSLPISKRPGFISFIEKAKNKILGVGKLVLRAWIAIALIGYVGIFLAVLLALLLSGRSDERGGGAGALFYVLLRVVAEALFWTFHPFSPFANNTWEQRQSGSRYASRAREQKVPFYERVNRFVFGPEQKKLDPRELERRIISQIRANKGRVGIADVMRVTGLPREEADPLMARLMLDYEGDVEVSEDGAIFYVFAALRRTAQETVVDRPPPPAWVEKATAQPVTGNQGNSNFLISALNGFNLLMSLFALQANLTLDRLMFWWQTKDIPIPVPPLPYDGVPLFLGLVPFVFSALIFTMPVYRWATQASREKQAKQENARRAVLKVVLESSAKGGVLVDDVKKAWTAAAGSEPDDAELSRQIAALGGDVDLDAVERGERAQYRFRDLEAEVAALQKEREQASESEKDVGEVVYRS